MSVRTERALVELDRLCELANIGAGHAAGVLAGLLERAIRMQVPRVRRSPGVDTLPEIATAGEGGIFFQVQGGLDGVLGVLFPSAARERLLERLLGAPPAHCSPVQTESALAELANMLASHALSAVAEVLGERVVPSVPLLLGPETLARLAAVAAPAPHGSGLRIETSLVDADGALHGVLVWLPRIPSAPSAASASV